MSGRLYPEGWAKLSALLVFAGFNLTFFPQFLLGYLGMPRRYAAYPEEFQALNVLSSAGASILALGYVLPIVYLLWSLRYGPIADANPWRAPGWEWQTTSPPGVHNFEETPVVREPPYTCTHSTADWRGPYAGPRLGGLARLVHPAVPHAARGRRPVLALRRHRVDLSLPPALPGGGARVSHASHDVPLRPYALVLAALLLLTAVTTGIAFVDLGAANVPIALGIAATKATLVALVALVFMRLRESTRLTIAVVIATLFWLMLLLGLTMTDYLTRQFMTFG
jgi:caa(3)-type oxidase subunit IV